MDNPNNNSQSDSSQNSSSSLFFAHRTMPEIPSQPPVASESSVSSLSLSEFKEEPAGSVNMSEENEGDYFPGLQKHFIRLLERIEKLESENKRLHNAVEALEIARKEQGKCISDLKEEISLLRRKDEDYPHKKFPYK